MRRVRITAKPHSDPSNDLRRLANIRRDLYARSPVEIDPDNPAFQTKQDENGLFYFEFATDYYEEVKRVLQEFGHNPVELTIVSGPTGEPCLNCGHVAGDYAPSVCPNCGFRDIAPCPSCHREVSRQQYVQESGDLFHCPHCYARVRLSFNDPIIKMNDGFNQPVVLVELAAQVPA